MLCDNLTLTSHTFFPFISNNNGDDGDKDFLTTYPGRIRTQKRTRHKQKNIKRESKMEKWFHVEEEKFTNKEKNDTS